MMAPEEFAADCADRVEGSVRMKTDRNRKGTITVDSNAVLPGGAALAPSSASHSIFRICCLDDQQSACAMWPEAALASASVRPRLNSTSIIELERELQLPRRITGSRVIDDPK